MRKYTWFLVSRSNMSKMGTEEVQDQKIRVKRPLHAIFWGGNFTLK